MNMLQKPSANVNMQETFSLKQGTSTKSVASPDAGFAAPDSIYAPSMFWFWNDAENIFNPQHNADMATEICDKGINPGFVHARLFRSHVPYWLSDEWYESFGAALQATEKAGMHMSYTMGDPCFPDKYFLADHHDFPNFKVGGIELQDYPELKAVSLDCQILDVTDGKTVELPEAFFAVAARVDADGKIISDSLQVIAEENNNSTWTPADEDCWKVYCFTKVYEFPSQYKINFLDRRLAEPWLELENTKYTDLFSGYFGKTMGGVFFDLEGFFGYKLTWSDDLAAHYKEANGVDIRERMPLLLAEDASGLWMKARHDWFASVAVLYAECVFEPMDRWCRSHNMYQTCHFWEEDLMLQSTRVADYMAMQRELSMPGTDALFETIHDPRYFKEVQSVCEFEGRQLMCEAFGIAGWHITPARLKTGANSGVAMGVTQLMLHGPNTSREMEKVSYPPDFYDCNPYWRYFRQYGDFVRRASYVNDHGRLDADVLLYCPLDSVNALVGDDYFDMSKVDPNFYNEDISVQHSEDIKAIEDAYSAATRMMYVNRIDYCVADCHYMQNMQVEGGKFGLGEFSFSSLILPPLTIIDLKNAEKIVRFAEAGGRVYALGELPVASTENGGGDAKLAQLMERLRCASGFVAATVEAVVDSLQPCVEFVSGEFPLIATCRKIGDRSFFWLANNTEQQHEFTLAIPGVSGSAEIWNCETGEMIPVGAKSKGDSLLIDLTLESSEAYWMVIDPDKAAEDFISNDSETSSIELTGEWLVSIDSTDQPPSDIPEFKIPEKLVEGMNIDSLTSWLDWGLEKFSGFVDYTKTIELDTVTGNEVLSLGEVKHTAEVWVNGKSAGGRMWGPFTFGIGKFLQPGKNEVKIKVGNLVLNSITRIEDYNWKWFSYPETEQLDCGLFGPVEITNIK